MKKIGFVIPWFHATIPCGAEMELRELTSHLHEAGVALEILTTCVREFTADWNVNYFKEGVETINGIPVRRFRADKRDTQAFDAVNYKFMTRQPVTYEEEEIYLKEMVNSAELCRYLKAHEGEYSLFVFIPYMFGTTYYGAQVCPEKTVLIPCLHDEAYAYMKHYKKAYSQIGGMIFHAKPEMRLAEHLFDKGNVKMALLGEGIDTDLTCEAECFREKYRMTDPYILYAGRKDTAKNIYTLIRYFREFKKRNNTELKLVLIGGGEVHIPSDIKTEVIDLGYVPKQDKYDANAAALFLCQPSHNESFSLVVMESWLCGRPVLVHNQCAVTKNFAIETNGGLYFDNYFEFEGCTRFYLEHREEAEQMGKNGGEYVRQNFNWDTIVEKYKNFFEQVAKDA